MDFLTNFPLLLFSFFLPLAYVILIILTSRRNSRLPPGPFPLPVIGNLLCLGDKPHHSLAALSKHYGPLMSLKLGRRTTIVVSSPDIAKEFFQKHDHLFSSRTIPDSLRMVDHDKHSIVFLPAEDQWRKLRKICKECIFSMQRLDASELLRRKKIEELIDHVSHCSTNQEDVNVGGIAFTTTLNILSNVMFSMDFAQFDSVSSQEFKETICGVLDLAGKPNIADFFPILKPFDPQGFVRQGTVYAKKMMTIFDTIINQRLQTRSSSSLTETNNDVLDLLLNLYQKNESEFTQNEIRHLLFALFMAGSETTSSTLEWAMTELIRNPEKLETARSEVIKLKKNKNDIVHESDISKLPYLQAVIKETLRLYPPVTFLVPHQAMCDTEIHGYMVPKNAQVLCNLWAMGRDPKIWSCPETFLPERFLEVKTDYKGQDFEFIPFGTGRRICPGLNLAHRTLHTILGSLILKFDWKLEGNVRARDIDMEEKFAFTLQRNVPLKAIPLRL